MGKIRVKVDNEVEREFKKAVEKWLGKGKDKIDEATNEAIENWIKERLNK